MAFFVKNISITSISVHGIILDVNSKVDLTLTVSNADIITSLLSGELFDKITGRALAIVDISTLRTLGATTNELSTFARIGYFQGRLGVEDFKDPFTFNADGYLMTTASIGDITVESQSEVEGRVLDGASAAGIKPVIIAGVDETGNAQNLIVNSDGYLMTSTAISIETNSEVEGRVADGASAAGVKPVIIAGVDEAGNAQNLIVNSDGYLMTSTAISVETTSEVEGRVLDGASAAGIKPVIVAGVDSDGYAQNIQTDGYGNIIISKASFSDITVKSQSEVEGRVLDGSSAAGIKPVIIAGVDEAGNAQNLIVNSDGYLMTSTAISVETNAEVEGRVADGSSVTSIKPILIGGQDEDGYAQSLLVSTDGEVHVAGYDAALDAVRTFETAPLNYFFVVETLVNATNQAAATYYYTTTIDNYKDLSLEMEISANITITIEASNDIGFTTAKDITKSGNELVNGSSGYVSFTTGNYILDFDDINVSYVRVKAIISSSPNSLKIVARKKAL
jgi:hypothetical protein